MLLTAVILAFFAYKYFQVQDYKLVAVEKTVLLKNAADNFYKYSIFACFASWIWSNIAVIKTKQKIWLCFPFLFTAFAALLMRYMEEDIFLFNKENGMWKGGFSISSFASIFIIIIAAIVFGINYLILKKKLRR